MNFVAINFIIAIQLFGWSWGVDVTLDHRDAGFFLRFPSSSTSLKSTNFDTSVSEKFTLLYPSSSVTVRATYGPISVKQTVLPALLVPSSTTFTTNITDDAELWSASGILSQVPSTSTMSTDLEISAHLVTHEIPRDKPVLRVLFHSNRVSDPKPHQHMEDKGVFCVALYVHYRGEHLMSVCSLSASRDGVCLGEVVLPATWWPPLESGAWKTTKQQKSTVRVEYALLESNSMECTDSGLPVTAPANVQSVYLANVSLSSIHGSYEEIKSDDVIRILVPQGMVYPRSKVYVPVYLMPNPAYPLALYVFTIRARVKSGIRILGAQVAQPSKWKISLDFKAKETIATVTAFVKDTKDQPEKIEMNQPQEVFSWLFEVAEDAGYHDSGRIVWQLRYALDSSMTEQHDFDDSNTKMTSRLDIQKDDVQAVLPIAKSTQLLNTAVLTGKQVSQPMKVFVVSQAGKVGDVTLQSSCHAADESILKVSPSCTSVYLDGSEIRGSQNASVLVKYGTYTGQAHFLVWMPEFPLEVKLSDNKLSQIKGWRTPRVQKRKYRASPSSSTSNSANTNDSDTPLSSKNSLRWDDSKEQNTVCRLRYQQADVSVYTRFFSLDYNSGREAYLLNRKVAVRVTELVAPFLRVADSRIASLKGNIVQGQDSGRTEVQVLSPITGRVIGAREIRIGSDKETVTHLEVTVVSGLHLAVFPDDSIPNVFTAQTAVTRKLTSQYQEGLLDVRLHFSDGSIVPLTDISESDYHLSVDSFDSGIVAFAPAINFQHPRVIAIGQGKGELLHVSLELSERCQKRRSQPMAMSYAYVEVDYSTTARTNLQNDAHFKLMKGGLDANGNKFNKKMLVNQNADSILYQDAINPGNVRYHEPAVQARQNLAYGGTGNLTPLEIGMYSLLGVFCTAIFVFVITCTVFAVRYQHRQKQTSSPTLENGESVAHAHDWVWLGRATLERNSVNTRCSQTLMPLSDFNGNGPAPNHPLLPAANGTGATMRKPDQKGTLNSATLPEKKAISRMHRSSNISFPGSEISIRITTNPHQLQDKDEDDELEVVGQPDRKETTLIEGGAITSLTNHNAFHLPSETDLKKNNGTVARTKNVRIQQNPILLKESESREPLKNFSTFTKSTPVPPPVPPHRNVAGNNPLSIPHFPVPPPVPPHAHRHSTGSSMISSMASSATVSASDAEKAKQLKEMLKNVNLTENPILASNNPGWEHTYKGMNYDQLMEYFVNLKESNA